MHSNKDFDPEEIEKDPFTSVPDVSTLELKP